VTIKVRNNLSEIRSIVIEDPLTGGTLFDSGPIPPTDPNAELQTLESFKPTRAGTYIYRDPDLVQTLLGLHGAMVVMPKDRPKFLYGVDRENDGDDGLAKAPTFDSQYCWMLHDIDPLWGAIAADQVARGQPVEIDGRTFLPRYFTINGASGGNALTDATHDRRTVPVRHLNSSALIRIVNCGGVVHSCHFHGNHVFVYTENHRAPFRTDPVVEIDPFTGAERIVSHPVAPQKDVLRMDPLSIKDVLLPCHEPLDQYPPYNPNSAFLNVYPMHCHAEMSQTAGGGNYPSGMLSDWELLTEPERGPRPLGCSRC
jgi:hypothetical protein